jgi:imidazolonepropionase-like amidohydrolase
VNICLGTDSLVTVRKAHRETIALDLFTEMQAFARAHPGVAPAEILAMVTRNPAHALGLASLVGALRAGASADMIAIPFDGSTAGAGAGAVHHDGPVVLSLVRGRWVIPPPGRDP